MRYSVVTLALVAAALAGCNTTIVKKEIVTVDKPVPFIPSPPDVPKCVSQVDKLVAEDRVDPGKVGQAYKYDMLCYRQRDKIVQMIIDQYKAGSQNFDQVNKEIDELFKRINQAESDKVKELGGAVDGTP